jgi:hypothetical protein
MTARALKVPELKGHAGIMKSYELAEKKPGQKIGLTG